MNRRRIATIAYVALGALFLVVVWSEFSRVRSKRQSQHEAPTAESTRAAQAHGLPDWLT